MDWHALKKLRSLFLGEGKSLQREYWTPDLLQLYDQTFAQRIGWKWDAVFSELKSKGWQWPAQQNAVLVDWGCGTGIASRKFLQYFPAANRLCYFDKNAQAVKFAQQQQTDSKIEMVDFTKRRENDPLVLLVSHVLNELEEKELEALVKLCQEAHTFFWVEPGTPSLSRKLISLRERLKETFSFLAPCPHQMGCGMLQEKNVAHWCHHFAKPPAEVFQSSFWRAFSEELGIDLRSLPVSYLVGTRHDQLSSDSAQKDRIIGRARIYKGYAQALVCAQTGDLQEQKILQRHDPAQFKLLKQALFHTTLSQSED